jgi:hypothetical protein
MLTNRFPVTIVRSLAAAACVVSVATGCTLQSVNKAASEKHSTPISTIGGPSHTGFATAQSLISDVYSTSGGGTQWGKNQAVLRGIPLNFDWASGAVGRTWDTNNYKAVTPWGQIFEAGTAGSPVRNVRVQVKSLQVYWLINGKWKVVTPPSGSDGMAEGGYYSSNFASAIPMASRNDGGGITSFSLTPSHDLGHPVAHFWWSGWYPRPTVPAGATAMEMSVDMRLVPADGTTADLSKAKYIAGVSIDEDKTPTDVPGGAKGSLGMPAHKMLSASWQRFGFTNLSPAQIIANPPPVRTS